MLLKYLSYFKIKRVALEIENNIKMVTSMSQPIYLCLGDELIFKAASAAVGAYNLVLVLFLFS